MSWTDEKVATLKQLWTEGLTTGEIGKRLGVSKNAVVGKAHRLELESRPSPIKRKEATKVVEKVKEVESGKMSITDLTLTTCRWPIGDPKDDDFHFCGKKIPVGRTYCPEHAHVAYVKPNKK